MPRFTSTSLPRSAAKTIKPKMMACNKGGKERTSVGDYKRTRHAGKRGSERFGESGERARTHEGEGQGGENGRGRAGERKEGQGRERRGRKKGVGVQLERGRERKRDRIQKRIYGQTKRPG